MSTKVKEPNENRIKEAESLFGILKEDIALEQIKEERLKEGVAATLDDCVPFTWD